MKSKLLLWIFLFASINLFGSEIEKNKYGIVYHTNNGFISLQVYSDNIIRVLISPVQKPDLRKSLIVTTAPVNSAKWSTEEDKNSIALSTKKVTAKIDKSTSTVTFYDATGKLLLASGKSNFVPDKDSTDNFYHIEQKFRLSSEEAIYGLGQYQQGVMNWRNHDVTLFQKNREIAIPVIISTNNYGILWDNYSLTKFHDEKKVTSLWSDVADVIDYYFIGGNNFDKIISGYRFLTGKVPMFGKWVYGYWQSKERYHTQDEIVGTVKEYRKRKLPLDLIIQDWMYWGDLGWSALDFDRKKFPEPAKMMDDIHKMNTHIMISIWPNFSTKSEVYTEMKEKGFLIGKGKSSQNRGLYDAYNPAARDLYWQWLNKNMFSKGMDGWWMDATEPEVQGNSFQEQIDNFIALGNNHLGSMRRYMLPFAMLSTKGVYEHQRATTNKKRVVILTRSGFAGQQKYGAVSWSGDIHAQWNIFRNQIPAGLNFCATGLPYWTTDIGAFIPDNPLGNKDNAYREIYLRWFQFGVFNPIFRSHGSGTAREIWNFGGANSWTYKPLEKFDNFRYRLLPYIYSLAWQVTSNDYTLMRALPFDFKNDANVYNIDNQYMFGNAFLVRPVTEKMYYEKNYLGELVTGKILFDKNGNRGGFTTTFYNGIDFDTLVTTEVKSKIDFDWNDNISRPDGVHQHYYSIRFEGEIEAPETGKYTFLTTSNDGIRVILDGETILENWTPHGATVDMGDIELEAGRKYKITVEYFQTLGGAVTKLTWIKPSVAAKLQETKVPHVKSVQVYLPQKSDWYDFWRGDKFSGGQTIEVPAPIDEIPLMIKAGSIIPLGPYLQYAEEKPADPLELRVYTGADAEFVIYEDEGDSYNYENGVYATIIITWNERKQTLTIGDREGEFPGMLKKRTFRIIWVDKNHGTGVEPETKADKIIKYSGNEIVVHKL